MKFGNVGMKGEERPFKSPLFGRSPEKIRLDEELLLK